MIDAFVHHQYFPAFLSFLAVVSLTPLFIKLAPALKLIDPPDGPDGRKQHVGDVPLIGGLVIFPVFLACAIGAGFSIVEYWPFYVSIILLLVTGAADDVFHIRPWYKFAVQCLVAVVLVVFGDAHIRGLGDLFGFGDFNLGVMFLPFSLAAVVLLINAVNLMDGLDGLSSGTVFVALGWIGFATLGAGDAQSALMILIMMGAILGFLIYNMRHPFRSRAALFLGDAGSLCLGLTLAWFAISAGKNVGVSPLEPMGVAWILALPIFDTCAQFYRRVRLGRHPFAPDRGHFHHHFIEAGVADRYAVLYILMLSALLGAVGVFLVPIDGAQLVLTVLWIVMLLGHMWVSDKPERYVRVFSALGTKG